MGKTSTSKVPYQYTPGVTAAKKKAAYRIALHELTCKKARQLGSQQAFYITMPFNTH